MCDAPLEPLMESLWQRFTAQLDPHLLLHHLEQNYSRICTLSFQTKSDVFLEWHTLLRLALAWVLRWKDPMLPIFMNKVFKVWTLWSAAALCIIIITLMSKTIAASNATLDIYMKVVSKQVMTTRRLMTVCNVNESFALFQMVMLSHHRRSQLEVCSKR